MSTAPAMTSPVEPPAEDPGRRLEADSLSGTGVVFGVGEKVESVFSNGEWYPASITAVHADGRYDVLFEASPH